MVEIIINDGLLGSPSNEERIIRLVSTTDYDNDIIKESVEDLMHFFYRYASTGFLTELTRAFALNQRDDFKRSIEDDI